MSRSSAARTAPQTGADAHIDAMASKYIGQDTYPFRQPDEQRVTYRITADRVRHQKQG